MRKQMFGLTIALFLLMFFGAIAEAEKITLIPYTEKPKQDTSDEAEMETIVTMEAWYSPPDNGDGLHLIVGKASSDVYATYERNNTEYDCKAWIKGSGDTSKKSTPQTENLKPKKKVDSQGREYHEDSYDDGFRYAAIKYHPVGHSKPWPWTPAVIRTLSLYDIGVVNRLQDSPSNIKSWPHSWAEVKGVARNNTRPTLDHFHVELQGRHYGDP